MKPVFYRLNWIMIVLVLGLTILPTSYAQRPLPRAQSLTDTGALVLNETFDGNALPSGWQVTGEPAWSFDNPGARENYTGGTGNMAISDSDFAGSVPMDTALLTPALDLSTASSVKLNFNTYFAAYDTSTADVDVSFDSGATWTNIWRATGADYQGAVTLNVPEAAGQGNVLFRFRYYDANYAWYWQVDDVQVETPSAPDAPDTLNAVVAGNNVDLTWADNSSNEANFIVERSPNGSDWVEAGRVGANVTAFTHLNVECGTPVYYRVKATNGALQSGYSNTANITMPACPLTTTGITQNFDAAQSLPAGWTVAKGSWDFTKPNTTGGSGNALYGNPVKSELRTPVFNMVGASAVLLKFKTDIKIYAGQSLAQDAYVDISQDGGSTWTTVWDKTTAYKGLVVIDLSQWAADRNNLMVRFLTQLPYGGSYWQLDDVEIISMPVPNVPVNLTATLTGNSDVILGWNGSDGSKYKVERSAAGGNWTQLADITDGATSYVDQSVLSFTTYQYRVQAYNAAGQSSYSATSEVTTGDKSLRYVDVTISLYAGAPIGTPADRAKYEAVIGYFADAVYESSNGVSRIRKVTIYRDAKNFDTAHIQWIASCHPNANVGGYIRPGTGVRVEMCDAFGTTQFLATVKNQQDAGGTIAHEWGHFYYGLYDEYKGTATSGIGSPQVTDPGTSTSMMTSQWGGFSNLNRFNFSTPVLNFTLQSAQGRVFGADAWTVLSRPKNQDPQNSAAANRPYWPELAAAAPASGQTKIELPGGSAAARAALQIVWEPGFTARIAKTDGPDAMLAATNDVIREIVIDRSALMADSGYLDAVKSAVATLIDQSVTGDTLGLIAFDGAATVVQPLTDISDQTAKDTLIAALNGIAAGDENTAGGDALQTALTALTAPSVPEDTTRAVYYITAGKNNTGINATTVVPGFQDAGISLHIFGFAPVNSDEANLRLLAELTQGEYTTVQDVGDLQKALGQTEQNTSLAQDVTLAYDFSTIVPGDPLVYTLAVDETLNRVNFEFTYYGEALSATITLRDPDNVTWPVDPATYCQTDGAGADAKTTCYIGFLDPGIGDWTVTVEASDTDIFVSDYETGVAVTGQTTYDPVITVIGGDVVDYPQPIVVEAKVSRDYPIGGLFARGWTLEPDGSLSVMTFKDDGVAPDTMADDGTYSAYIDYTQNGLHWVAVHFDNYDGKGFYTDKGLMTTQPVPLPLVPESFERYAEVQVMVNGWQEDDHANWPDDPNLPATVLPLDNIQVPGRIDFANDDDVFKITVPNDYSDTTLGVRINRLGLGMDPYVVVYAEDYSWQFVRFLENVATSDDTLFIPINAKPGETFYVEVWHYDETDTGTYNISAGPYLWSDPVTRKTDSIHVFLPLITKN